MTVLIASDHAGFELKESLKKFLPEIEWKDLGPENGDRTDYPIYADKLAKELKSTDGYGVLICGSGQGMCMRANRYPHIRAAMVYSNEVAELVRAHNNANVICLGGRLSEVEETSRWVQTFLKTSFEGGRHEKRVNMLSEELK